jgi:DNA polymerase-3 subunit epsilon
VYIFRDSAGAPLYVGKSVSIRSRARAHFAPSTGSGEWTAHAAVVDYRTAQSELGALVLENRLIKELRPPGNVKLNAPPDERLVYLRCRLDIPFPILEVAAEPASGHAVTVGPLRGRRHALELVEQLDSLFGLRHCGRTLRRRDHPSAYGQMGRCLSPCLGDLDPNLYRRRLEQALQLFDSGDGRPRLLEHVEAQMRLAADERRYERAAWLRRRLRRLTVLLERLGGVLEATHAVPRLVVAPHPCGGRPDAFWLAGGRLVDWGALPDDAEELERRTAAAVARGRRPGELGAHLTPGDVDDMRIISTWLAAHEDTPRLALDPVPEPAALAAFVAAAAQPAAAAQSNGNSATSAGVASEPTLTAVPGGASRRISATAT